MGPTSKKKKNKVTAVGGRTKIREERERVVFFSFYSFSFLSQIPEFLTVGIRRDKHEKCSTRRGLRVSTKNMGFHLEFR